MTDLHPETQDPGPTARIVLHLHSGTDIVLLAPITDPGDDDPAEAAENLLNLLLGLDRPQFIRIDNTIVHTQALSAVELDVI